MYTGANYDEFIITYQVITGNYSMYTGANYDEFIITYQVITGNYSLCGCLL